MGHIRGWFNDVNITLYSPSANPLDPNVIGSGALTYELGEMFVCRKKDGMPRESEAGFDTKAQSTGQGEIIVDAEI
jgi:hypothetical protein